MTRNRLLPWLMPSVGDVLFVCMFFWVLKEGLGLLNDGDTGWHIITGLSILDTLKIPFSDPYSYTMPGTPWTAHEWLAEIILGALHRLGGLNSVVVFCAAVICLTSLYLYKFMVYRSVSPITAAVLTVLASLASAVHWLARPHAFSFPMTLAFIVALEVYQREGKDRLWWLPPLMAVWVNLHGGYILGIMLLGVYAAGNLAYALVGRDDDGAHMAKARRLGVITAATVAATFLNPHGPAILYFPFHLVGRQYIMDNIMEWLSPNFHTDRTFEIMLLYIISIFVLSRKKPDLMEGMTALMLVHMSLYSARYIPLLALAVVPMAASRTGAVLSDAAGWAQGWRTAEKVRASLVRISENTAGMEKRFGRSFWPGAVVAACLLVSFNGGSAFGRQLMDYRHDPKIFPVDALRFVMDNRIQGRMFNNDGWGGYIIYKAYPEYRVFFDGRSDMYGVDFLKEYVTIARAKTGYDELLDRYGVGWAIFNANSPLCQLLVKDGWKLVYADKTANVIVRDTPEYGVLIAGHPDVAFVRNDDED